MEATIRGLCIGVQSRSLIHYEALTNKKCVPLEYTKSELMFLQQRPFSSLGKEYKSEGVVPFSIRLLINETDVRCMAMINLSTVLHNVEGGVLNTVDENTPSWFSEIVSADAEVKGSWQQFKWLRRQLLERVVTIKSFEDKEDFLVVSQIVDRLHVFAHSVGVALHIYLNGGRRGSSGSV
ncbi:putative metyltransferase protein [Ranid herpesvirus 3]|uniref:Putative metyltransferase protein n=1 Tax=Ranid herpesvirus 3 TaxID=1987509 RepID=A0A1X9T5J1_9VIRU|nr:putative metyltransferase protein [Ranid herpesvirus 3]ARR28971.1 putative metyltransferase protein [Ranid herpesvirus 3]